MKPEKRDPGMTPEDAERMAEFLEGGLEGEERARLIARLGASPDELETLLVASEVMAEVEFDAPGADRDPEATVRDISLWRRRSSWGAIGLAAAALAAISLWPGEGDLLERAIPATATLGDGWMDHSWTTLRTEEASSLPIREDQRGFRVGVLVADLEVATREADDGARSIVLQQLTGLLAGGEFLAIRTLLPGEGEPEPARLWPGVEDFFGVAATRGRSLEAIRLAALAGNRSLLSEASVRGFVEALGNDFPGGAVGDRAAALADAIRSTPQDPQQVLDALDPLFALLGG
jgi:hypothetical protein